jgi:asparagine synthetase B (glutamine-hydrolysing)
MSFLINIPKDPTFDISLYSSTNEIRQGDSRELSICIEKGRPGSYFSMTIDDVVFHVIGDFIIPSSQSISESQYLTAFFAKFHPRSLRQTRGHFYIIQVNKAEKSLRVFNSMMSILPVYYLDSGNSVLISSRKDAIIEFNKGPIALNRKYLVEHFLFGYGFKDSTLFAGVKLMPTNNFIEFSSTRLSLNPHTDITDYYVQDPVPWKKSLNQLCELFIDRASGYLPDEPYYTSLTGGLDGRTLLALGLSNNKHITTYSYGSANDKDVLIPSGISKKIGIPYQPFILDETYARELFLKQARKANQITEGSIRFSRATYLFLSEKIAERTKYIVTGNFGSELMRTMRMSGNLISHIVFDIFESGNDTALAEKIKNSPKLKYLHANDFKSEIEEITQDCIIYRNSLDSKFTINQKFYKYLLEEVFRKYFGPELLLEQDYLMNRTPFLDFEFMSELFKSELAGCNGSFKVSSPFDRFKGQALYPLIIKKTYPGLLKFNLDRGYSPNAFLGPFGKLEIAYGFYRRKLLTNRNSIIQPSYNESVFERNLEQLKEINYNYSFVDIGKYESLFENSNWKNDSINFNIYISFFDHLNYVLNKYRNVELF